MASKTRIGDTADLLEVTTATIRNWIKHIGPEYFSETAARKTGKRFIPSDLQQLQRIKDLLADGLTYEDIPSKLPEPIPVVEILEDNHQDTYQDPTETPQEQTNALQVKELTEQFFNLLEQQRETHNQTISAKDETIEVLKTENERLRRERDRARLPWWKRLF